MPGFRFQSERINKPCVCPNCKVSTNLGLTSNITPSNAINTLNNLSLTKGMRAGRHVAYARKIVLICTAILTLTVILGPIWLPALGYWLVRPETMHAADVIVVHGGNNPRTQYGIALYQRGFAPELWHTGYARNEPRITAMMKASAIPDQAFHWLSTLNTWSDGQAIVQTIQSRQIGSVLIITDWWHSRRALCALKQQLHNGAVKVYFTTAPATTDPENWWHDNKTRLDVIHEVIGIAYYAVRYGMNPWGC